MLIKHLEQIYTVHECSRKHLGCTCIWLLAMQDQLCALLSISMQLIHKCAHG